jgi:hypothetical protein
MSEAIAKVVRDLKANRVVDPSRSAAQSEVANEMRKVHMSLIELINEYPCQIIDATSMYDQIVNGPAVKLYDEYRLLPVWESALIGYVNQLGNVYVIQTYSIDKEEDHWELREWDKSQPPYLWETENEVDWAAVRYRFVGVLWAGGRNSKGQPIETIGPLYRWDVAVYADGTLGDVRWTALYDFGEDTQESTAYVYQNAMLIWFQTYTLAGCSNVELVTPQRKRPERRRLERLGVNPKKIVIKKTNKSYRYHKDDTDDHIAGVPQGFVRGHYAHYGPAYDRGLLFGKYAGKFWIPARATFEVDREIDYVTEGASN